MRLSSNHLSTWVDIHRRDHTFPVQASPAGGGLAGGGAVGRALASQLAVLTMVLLTHVVDLTFELTNHNIGSCNGKVDGTNEPG